MKRSIVKVLKRSTAILILSGASIAQAQKLPKVQTTGIKAPVDIKIDGKPTEWTQFEAYNNATDFYYTFSNDNDNLYLAVQATDYRIIQKLLPEA